MANQVVNRTVNVYIQSGQAQAVYDKLIAKQKELTDQLAKNPKNAEAIRQQLERLEEPISRAAKKLSGELEPSLRDLQTVATKARNELSRMSESDPGFKERVASYVAANAAIEEQRGKVGLLSKAWKSFWTEAKTVAVGVVVGNTIQSALQTVLGYVTGIVTGSAKIADELADIEKTTGLTKDQVKEVSKELSKIDTRTSASDLRKLAEEAGKLGKDSVQDVVKFVDAADKIKVALGEDLGEDAIISLGKLSKIFKVEMLNIGSAINEIGANSEASESFAVEFLNRLAGTGPAVKLTADELLGYGAALEVAGQTAEVSGTSLSNFFIDFVRDSEKFGKAAGFAKGELENLINTKGTNEAFLQFLTRLKEADPDAQQFLLRMQELGVDGSRGANVMLALSNNIQSVRDQQLIANDAIKSNASIMDEFNKKNNNAAAELDKFKKNFASLFTSSSFQEAGATAIRLMSNFVNVIKGSFQFISDHKVLLASLTAIYLLVSKSIDGTTVSTLRNKAATQLKLALDVLENTVTRARAAALIIYGNVVNLVTGRITLAAAAQRIWNAVMALGAGPLGLILVAAGALIIGIEKLVSRTRELTAEQRIQASIAKQVNESTGDVVIKLRLLEAVLKSTSTSYADKKKAMEELIRINPDFAKTLTLNANGELKGAEAIGVYIQSLQKKAEAEAKYQLYVEKTKQRQDLVNQAKSSIPQFNGLTDDQVVQQIRDLPKAFRSNDKVNQLLQTDDEIKTLSKNMNELAQTAIKAGGTVGSSVGEGAVIAKGKLEELRQKLEQLQKDREKSTDDNAIANFNKQIAATEKEIARLEGRSEKVSGAVKKTINDTQQLAEELKKLATSLLPDDSLEQIFNKQLQELDDKYAAFREKAHGNVALLKQIDNLYLLDRDRLYAAQAVKFKENLDKESETVRREFAERAANKAIIIPVVAKLGDNAIKLAGLIDRDKEAKAELDILKSTGKARLQAQLRQLEDERKQALSSKELTENEKALIEEKFRIKRGELEKQYLIDQVNMYLGFAQQIVGIFDIISQSKTANENAELDRDRKINDKKKQNLERQLKSGVVTQLQYDRELKKIEKEQEEREKATRLKQFKRTQRMQIVQALMNGAQAVTSTLAAIPGPLDILSLGTARAIQIGLMIATTAAQVAVIAKQKPPEFARGGKLVGKSHREGGMGVYDHHGRKQAEMEGGEGVINKFTMRDNTRYTASGTPSQIASALNARHGGVHWESGAVLVPKWKNVQPMPMNFAAIRQAQTFAAGGTFNATPPPSTTSSGGEETAAYMLTAIATLVSTLDQLNGILAKGIIAKTFLTEQEAQQERLDSLRNDATMQP
ncbi:MAG: phage tail tape measure protein [Flavipsychrobacter sp.]